jgi:hypothetical protein
MPDAARTLAPLKPANPGNDGRDEARPPVMPFFHLRTGSDGTSRLERCSMTGFALESIGGGAAPQWMRDCPGEVEAVKFAVLPRGWVGEWHESPKPQWVVPLAGRWFLERTALDSRWAQATFTSVRTRVPRMTGAGRATVRGRWATNLACR